MRNQNDLTIEVPEEAFYLSGLQIAKKAVTADIQKYFPSIGAISFQETFKRPAEEAPPQLAEQVLDAAGETATPSQPETKKESQSVEKPENTGTKARRAKTGLGKSRKRIMAGSENQR